MTQRTPPVISVVGKKNSGKTWAVEALTSILSERGLRIAVIKHIHHRGWTLDTPGKDTWKHAQAGARIVMAVSPEEIGIIRRLETSTFSLRDLFRHIASDDLDLILLEGFHMKTADRTDIHKIVTAKSEEGLRETIKGTSPPILAVTGIIGRDSSDKELEIPVIDLEAESELLASLVEDVLLGHGHPEDDSGGGTKPSDPEQEYARD